VDFAGVGNTEEGEEVSASRAAETQVVEESAARAVKSATRAELDRTNPTLTGTRYDEDEDAWPRFDFASDVRAANAS
jgi:hypothetical protein